MNICNICKGHDIQFDSTRGENVCGDCGHVLEGNGIVSQVDFSESKGVVGKFVSKGGNCTNINSISTPNDSKEKRLRNANELIRQFSKKMKLKQYHEELALNLYNIVYDSDFVKGRHTRHVVAAVLYIICRQEKVPYLLIDFAAALQINLYVLGHCYLKLVKILHYQKEIPSIDPSLFIGKYCSNLDFEEKTNEVTKTATKLLQRMNVDWICYGRRPSSLCGAAIFIAARFHGFKRTRTQIVQTVHCCDETIRKRLEEFKETSVAQLTRSEFENKDWDKDLTDQLYPPSFKKALKNKELQKISNFEESILYEADKIESIENKLAKNTPTSLPILDSKQSLPNNPEILAIQETAVIEEKDQNQKKLEIRNEETLSDVSDSEISQFFLSPEEIAMKSIIWHNMHKNWVKEQAEKKDLSIEKKTMKKRKKKEDEKIEAGDPATAIQRYSSFKDKINESGLKWLLQEDYEEHIEKKIKLI